MQNAQHRLPCSCTDLALQDNLFLHVCLTTAGHKLHATHSGRATCHRPAYTCRSLVSARLLAPGQSCSLISMLQNCLARK